MDRLVVVKFHTNITNRWLLMIQRKIMAIIQVILTFLGRQFSSGQGVCLVRSSYNIINNWFMLTKPLTNLNINYL